MQWVARPLCPECDALMDRDSDDDWECIECGSSAYADDDEEE